MRNFYRLFLGLALLCPLFTAFGQSNAYSIVEQVNQTQKPYMEYKSENVHNYEFLVLMTAGLCQDKIFRDDVQFQPDEVLDDREFRSVQSYPELNPDSYWIYNNRQILRNICFPNDTIKHKRLSVKELRQLPFQTMPDSALRINFVNARDRGIALTVIGGIVVGAALVGVASGVRNFDLFTGEGSNLIVASFVFGGSLSTLSFISAGRNLRKAQRIRIELIRRGQM